MPAGGQAPKWSENNRLETVNRFLEFPRIKGVDRLLISGNSNILISPTKGNSLHENDRPSTMPLKVDMVWEIPYQSLGRDPVFLTPGQRKMPGSD